MRGRDRRIESTTTQPPPHEITEPIMIERSLVYGEESGSLEIGRASCRERVLWYV